MASLSTLGAEGQGARRRPKITVWHKRDKMTQRGWRELRERTSSGSFSTFIPFFFSLVGQKMKGVKGKHTKRVAAYLRRSINACSDLSDCGLSVAEQEAEQRSFSISRLHNCSSRPSCLSVCLSVSSAAVKMTTARYRPTRELAVDPLVSCKLCLGEFPLEQMTTITQCQCVFCTLVRRSHVTPTFPHQPRGFS